MARLFAGPQNISRSALVTGLVVILYLGSRLVFLDADLPDFRVSEYSPIDEFAYSVPAFNLIHYGTWTHQLAPWAPIEGWPMNVAQNVVAALTLWLGGYSYWGLRASSVLFGLVAFVSLWSVLRSATRDAVADGNATRRSAIVVEAIAVAVLLVDFGSLTAARGIEPTVSRFAAVAAILWATSRGWLIRPDQGFLRSVAFGLVASIGVWFVYIYNLFVLPAALLALLIVVRRAGSWRRTLTGGAGFLLGAAAGAGAYFGLIAAVYQQSPLEWYRVWIGAYDNSSRVAGASLANLASLMDANSLRFDPLLLLVALLGLPVFVWWVTRSMRPWSVLLLAALAMFVAQSAAVADYPYKKFLILLIFAVPIAAVAVLRAGAFIAWLRRHRTAAAACAIYAVVMLGLWAEHSLFGVRIGGDPRATLLIRLAAVATLVAGAAYVVGRSRLRPFAVLGLAAIALVPSVYADWRHLFGHPSYTYRDSLISAGAAIDGQTTAGGLSFGMQLYNTSTPVLEGYVYGLSAQEYVADVVRAFSERRASWLFAYTRSGWESRGFVLIETYPIKLPNGAQIGRYAFASSGVTR